MDTNPADTGGRVLLLLITRDAQSAEQLTAASGMRPIEILRQLHRLTEQGFIVAGTSNADVAIYRLNPKSVRTESSPHERLLVIEDDADLRLIACLALEHEGYAVIAVAVQVDAVSLLQRVGFDLVITDSLSDDGARPFSGTTEILANAGETPVVLFTGHRVELEAAQAAGFADLVTKPFALDVLRQHIRTLLAA